MTRTLLTNVRIFDGSGARLFPGEVLIEGDRIRTVAQGTQRLERSKDLNLIDGGGATLMPGMVEGHAHLTYPFSIDRGPPANMELMDMFMGKFPVEEHAYLTAHNAKVVLDSGFTSAYSAGGATRTMELALRREIEAGWVQGPRFKTSGTEGSMMPGQDLAADPMNRAESAEDVRQYVKGLAEVGVDVVKFLLSGPAPAGPYDNQPMYRDELLAAAQEQARESGVWLSGHARPAEVIKQGLKYGFRVLYHCDFIDEEILDMMEARKQEIFIGPSVGGPVMMYEQAQADPDSGGDPLFPGGDPKAEVERLAQNCQAMLKRGIRIVAGGDYGLFPFVAHGSNARDLLYFVKYMGMSPADALRTATQWGGELMGMGHELGLVKDNYLADLLLVDGDPLSDIGVLADRSKLLMIMKGGVMHKSPRAH